MSRELLLVRHGQTEWNAAGRIHGHGDSPLTELGRQQAAQHAERLAALCPERLVSSPLGRARATAGILAERLGLPVEQAEALRERDVGIYEGWSWQQLAERRPDEQARRLADPWRWRPPGGENFEDVALRLRPLLAGLRCAAAERIVVVSHGALARPLLGELLDLDERAMLDLRAPNDVVYRVRLGPPPAVSRLDASGERPGLLTGALQETLHYDPASRPER